MTGVPLTKKESEALLQLSQYLTRPEDIGLTDGELDSLETKLHVGPTNEFETRLTEAMSACRERAGGRFLVGLDIVELGVRVTVRSLLPRQECMLICPWTDIAMCRVNPLLSTIDRACMKLVS